MAQTTRVWTVATAAALTLAAFGAVYLDLFRVAAFVWGALGVVWFARVIVLTSRFGSSRPWLVAARKGRESDGWIVLQLVGLLLLPILLLGFAKRRTARVARAADFVVEQLEGERLHVTLTIREPLRSGGFRRRRVGREPVARPEWGRFVRLDGDGFDVVILRSELIPLKQGERYFAYRIARFERTEVPVAIEVRPPPSSSWTFLPEDVEAPYAYWLDGESWEALWRRREDDRARGMDPPRAWESVYERLLCVRFRTWP